MNIILTLSIFILMTLTIGMLVASLDSKSPEARAKYSTLTIQIGLLTLCVLFSAFTR